MQTACQSPRAPPAVFALRSRLFAWGLRLRQPLHPISGADDPRKSPEGDVGRRQDDLGCRGRTRLKFHPSGCSAAARVGDETRRYYRWLERMYLRHGPRAGSFFRYICQSFIGAWQERGRERPAYADIYERDLFQCSSPVCSRRDVTKNTSQCAPLRVHGRLLPMASVAWAAGLGV